MPTHGKRQRAGRPTRLVTQSEAARIIGIRRQNLAPYMPRLEHEEHAGRLFLTRASCERVRDERAAKLAARVTAAAS